MRTSFALIVALLLAAAQAPPARAATAREREILALQKRMNKERRPGAPRVPENGRYNPEMFQSVQADLKKRLADLVELERVDRLYALAEGAGRPLRPRTAIDAKLEAEILAASKGAVREGVEARLERRKAYLGDAGAAIRAHAAGVAALGKESFIFEPQAEECTRLEAEALRRLSLVILETQVFHVRGRIEATEPGAKELTALIDKAKVGADAKAKYRARAAAVNARFKKLAEFLESTRDYVASAARTDEAEAAINSAQDEVARAFRKHAALIEELEAAR